MKRTLILVMLGALLFAAGLTTAHAATRAWLERNEVAMGESVILNIESDQANATPDLSPLMVDFALEGQSNNHSVQWINGRQQSKTVYAITIAPKRAGSLTVPALQIGTQQTQPVALQVNGGNAPAAADGSSGAFLEMEVDDANPYVQQSVGVTMRLLYGVPLASGELDLDTPEGASLQRVGEDVQSTREVNGRRYNMVTRKFLLVPERSGELTIPGPRFVGRGAGGWMDDFLGGNSRELRANGASKTLTVRAQPANAPQPWLPLRDLRMRYVAAPQSLRAGEAAELVVEVLAIGATQAQMPELPTPSIAGAQVFAEPPQYDETFNNGTPQVKLTRRYSIVPNGAGKLTVAGIKLGWWDVSTSTAQTASLPDLNLEVAKGSGSFSASTLPDAAQAPAVLGASDVTGESMRIPMQAWVWMAVAFAGLWLLTLVWALWRRRVVVEPRRVMLAGAGPMLAPPTHTLADLKRALDAGSLDDVGDVLRGMSTPPSEDLDALLSHLDSATQRDAIEQLRRARWADGDGTRARSVLREAFRDGPIWRVAATHAKETLPPLYPRR